MNVSESKSPLGPVSTVLAYLLVIPLGIWTTWTGIVLWSGGSIPLLGWERERSPLASIIWFGVLEWLVGLAILTVAVMPFAFVEQLWRRRRPG